METETATWSEFPNGGKVTVEQLLVSGERNKLKRARLWELLSQIQVGKLTVWVRSNGLVVKALDSQSPRSKPLGGSKVDSALHPFEVDKKSTKNFWELSNKK